MAKLTISSAAKLAGVGIETVRYYQRIGLIPEPPKPASGYRTYTEQDVRQLQFIQRAKRLGFSLAEIKTLLALGSHSCRQTRQLASDKLAAVQDKIRDLTALADTLTALIDSCEQSASTPGCPLIEAITRHE